MMSKTELGRTKSGTVARLSDGTVATTRTLHRLPWVERVATVNALITNSLAEQPTVEVELRRRYGGDAEVLIGKLITAAVNKGGTTSDLLVLHEYDGFVPTAISLATVASISELTADEYAQRVHA